MVNGARQAERIEHQGSGNDSIEFLPGMSFLGKLVGLSDDFDVPSISHTLPVEERRCFGDKHTVEVREYVE